MKYKKCCTCEVDKPTSEFRRDKTRKDGLRSNCKECAKTHSHNYYHSKWRDKALDQGRIRRKQNRNILAAIKQESTCIICGEDEPCCLDFHHLDPSKKDFTISEYAGAALHKLLNEADKCVVLCKNCHQKVHHNIICLIKSKG